MMFLTSNSNNFSFACSLHFTGCPFCSRQRATDDNLPPTPLLSPETSPSNQHQRRFPAARLCPCHWAHPSGGHPARQPRKIMGQPGIKHTQSQTLVPLLPNLRKGFPFRGSRNVTHSAATRQIRCVIPYGIQTRAANAMHTHPEPFQVPFFFFAFAKDYVADRGLSLTPARVWFGEDTVPYFSFLILALLAG